MIKRTVEISRDSAHLAVRQKQLLVQRGAVTIGQIPCEDIGMVLVDHPQVTYSHAALVELADASSVVVICGRSHLPTAILLPLSDHTQVVSRLELQLSVSQPVKKRVWSQLVRAKIRAQAVNLTDNPAAQAKLRDFAKQVKSGDSTNREAQAARVYWGHFLPAELLFRRDADGDGLNALLNYGYAIIRAAIARAIVGAGLLPALGIFHSNRSNQFCLADDLIEPLRPLVDDRARELFRQGFTEINTESKTGLLKLLTDEVKFAGEVGPLMVSLHGMVASLVKCFAGEAKVIEVPQAMTEQEKIPF